MKVLCINSNHVNFKNKNLHPVDFAYKKSLQKGLKDTFNLSCKVEDLASIAGPIELKEIIENLQPKHYEVGENYRANFHIHTVASDGRLTPKLFLEQCKSWADEIFKKLNPSDALPAFAAAITDHDRVKSVKEVVALISQNPDDYKNFKFVAGCEFMFNGYDKPYSAFEAVGLGFNPFDKNLDPMMKGFESKNQVADIKKVIDSGGILSWAHPIISPDKLNEDFFQFLKDSGVNGVEGYYQYIHWDKDYVDEGKKILEPLIKKFNMFLTGGTDSHSATIFGR